MNATRNSNSQDQEEIQNLSDYELGENGKQNSQLYFDSNEKIRNEPQTNQTSKKPKDNLESNIKQIRSKSKNFVSKDPSEIKMKK